MVKLIEKNFTTIILYGVVRRQRIYEDVELISDSLKIIRQTIFFFDGQMFFLLTTKLAR